MPKLRVYQLARELNRDNAEIIRELQHMGVPVTSHSNTVEDRLADRLRRELGVFAPADGKRVAADTDDFVAIDTPDVEELAAVIEETAKAEPETPHIEAKAEPKVEETPAPERKVTASPSLHRHNPWRRSRHRHKRLRLLHRLRRRPNNLWLPRLLRSPRPRNPCVL